MFNIFWRTLKDKRWATLIYCLAGALLFWMFISVYPTVQGSSAQISEFVKKLPPELNKAFGLDPETFTTFEGYVAGKHFSLLWPILVIALAVSLAASYVAGEIENGTNEFFLAQPVSRIKIFLSKSLAGIMSIILFVITSTVLVVPVAGLYNISVKSENFFVLMFVGILFGLAVFGLSMLFSSIFSEKGKAIFLPVGILLFMYVINIVALLKDSLDKLKYLSLFYYFDYSEILLHGKTMTSTWLVLGGTFLIATFAGLLWFNRRDIAI